MSDHLETLRQHNAWRRGESVPMIAPAAIGEAIDATIAEVEQLRTGDTCGRQCEGTAYRIEARRLLARNEMLEQGARRYEFVRKLAPFRFAELFQENLRGKLSFDQIIDREMHHA